MFSQYTPASCGLDVARYVPVNVNPKPLLHRPDASSAFVQYAPRAFEDAAGRDHSIDNIVGYRMKPYTRDRIAAEANARAHAVHHKAAHTRDLCTSMKDKNFSQDLF